MNKRVSFGFMLAIFFAINYLFNYTQFEEQWGIPSPIIIFIVVGLLLNVFRKVKNSGHKEDTSEPRTREYDQNWDRRSNATHECEYCGHVNSTDEEYCSNCGARQLPQ